jgi:lincosamide nucleotidyltransferase A/C/D/E
MGEIEGQPVRCISPEWAVKFHSGYELKDRDFRDVLALCSKFGISIPDEYAKLT